LRKDRRGGGQGGTSGREGITRVEISGGGHGRANEGLTTGRVLVCASPGSISPRSLNARQMAQPPHVIPSHKPIPRLNYDIKHVLRLFTIERGRSIQHSIHKVLLLTPPRMAPMPPPAKIAQSSVILNCSSGIGLKLLMSIDRNLNTSS
jgi:hypothetical protein